MRHARAGFQLTATLLRLGATPLELCGEGEPHRAQFWTQMVTTALLAGTTARHRGHPCSPYGGGAVHSMRNPATPSSDAPAISTSTTTHE